MNSHYYLLQQSKILVIINVSASTIYYASESTIGSSLNNSKSFKVHKYTLKCTIVHQKYTNILAYNISTSLYEHILINTQVFKCTAILHEHRVA